ncbi:MAG: V-type ATP synthase subunit I [Pseudoramibacter sp.]|jgi:V/A-type H+-transporting ATPase subunit I
MIIPMRKMKLIVFREDEEAILKALQKTGEYMPINLEDSEDTQPSENKISSEAQQAAEMLKLSNQYHKKYYHKLFEDQPEISYDTFLMENVKGKEICQQLQKFNEHYKALELDIENSLKAIEELLPWEKMDIPLDQIKGSKYVEISTVFLPESELDNAVKIVEEEKAQIQIFDVEKKEASALVVQTKKEMPELLSKLKELGMREVILTKTSCSASEKIAELREKIRQDRKEKINIEQSIKKISEDEKDIKLLNEQYETKQNIDNVKTLKTNETVLLLGWVCEDRIEKVKKVIDKTVHDYDLQFDKPTKKDKPPTVTRNPRFWAQFETITDMYSKPSPTELDPALVAGPWYWIIFGMMMGDVGYGICMFFVFYIFRKLKKPKGNGLKLVNTLLYSSITTIVFGVLFGSYFGETWHPILFAPLTNPMKMLIFTLVVGVLHIFSGMSIKIVEQFKAGHPWDAIFDQVSWMILITGLGLLFLQATRQVGAIMAIAGAAIILCTAGRENKNVVKKITGGLLGLYNISSYLSDILSYSRILALSLATGVIGMVMNLLARMVAVNIVGIIVALFIYFIGHTFNLAMSLLSAYVHDSRLQYIEFFNKFYEGGGIPFEPLSIKSKYVNVNTEENKK